MSSQFRLTIVTFVSFVTLAVLTSTSPSVIAQSPGGFVEESTSAASRSMLTATQIQNLLPTRGSFIFPAPYNTQAVRITNSTDCGGQDCVNGIGYSYWRNINNHLGSDSMLIIVGMDRSRGGAGPTLFVYNKLTDQLSNAGPVFDSTHSFSWSSGEGFYFSATQPTTLYTFSNSSIQRYDVISKKFTTVIDVTTRMGAGYVVWQTHSSDDDLVHSATIRNANTYAMLGCMTYREDTDKFNYYPAQGEFDECQIDKSGKWLLIKENVDGINAEDNRIIGLDTGEERLLLDRDGAAGHSDLGHGYMIASDNWANEANTVKVWDFNQNPLQGVVAYANRDWNVEAPAHISHSNAQSGVALEQQYSCGSSANSSNSKHANEIICFRHDSSRQTLVVAPVMTSLGSGDSYTQMPKGNLDVSGKYFIWTSNMGGNRLDAFLVKVPGHLLVQGTSQPTPIEEPVTEPVADTVLEDTTPSLPVIAAVNWTELVNVKLHGTTLYKSAGCDGCNDAGARSVQTLTDTGGYLEFTMLDSQKIMSAGLSSTSTGVSDARINFGLRFQGRWAEVRENGNYRADVAFKSGDTFRITVSNGKVSYAHNGSVFFTSAVQASYPLRGDAVFNSIGSSISAAAIVVVVASQPAPIVSDTNSTSSAIEAVNWTELLNVKLDGTTLYKSAGCDGCNDAGARSVQTITNTGGYMEFKVLDNQKIISVGLSQTSSGKTASRINFGLRLQAGWAEVRENGIYRADIAFKTGDSFRISVSNGKVVYAHNGKVFYTSEVTPGYPLRADAVLNSLGSSVSAAAIFRTP